MSKGSGGPEESWGPHSVEKRGPECTRGVLRGLHGPEMPLGKKGEIWRDSEETRGCVKGPGDPKDIWVAQLCGKGASREH